jgi:hypothetical protein
MDDGMDAIGQLGMERAAEATDGHCHEDRAKSFHLNLHGY